MSPAATTDAPAPAASSQAAPDSNAGSETENVAPPETTTFTGNPNGATLTAPGTQLRYGQPAVLPISYAGSDGVFTFSELTVTKGSTADWTTLGVDASEVEGQVPWFLNLTVKQESGGDFTYLSVENDLWGYGADDAGIAPTTIFNTANSVCASTGPDGEFAVGDTYHACAVLAVDKAQSIQRIQFEGDYDFESPYFDKPVVWKG